jgi:hypothetical protein
MEGYEPSTAQPVTVSTWASAMPSSALGFLPTESAAYELLLFVSTIIDWTDPCYLLSSPTSSGGSNHSAAIVLAVILSLVGLFLTLAVRKRRIKPVLSDQLISNLISFRILRQLS